MRIDHGKKMSHGLFYSYVRKGAEDVHKYGDFDEESAGFYQAVGRAFFNENPLDIGLRRQLRIDLMNKYHLTELEALNVLNGKNIQDYVLKYRRIEKQDGERSFDRRNCK